jgi:hypothetical protein
MIQYFKKEFESFISKKNNNLINLLSLEKVAAIYSTLMHMILDF